MRSFALVVFALFCVIANAQVLPEGAYNIANQGGMYFNASEVASVYINQQLFEVAADGVSITWSTRMNTQNAGENVQALVTLAMIASAVEPSGNLIFSITECLQNNLDTRFPYDMCTFLYSPLGCTGVEFVYGQADVDIGFVNQTLIVINRMCGLVGSSAFICQSAHACSSPVNISSSGKSLPHGEYDLYGPGFVPFTSPGLSNVLMRNSNITVNTNTHSITLFIDVSVSAPISKALYGASMRFDGYIVNAGSGGFVMSFTDCIQFSFTPSTPPLCGAFMIDGIIQGQFSVPQIDLTPQNTTANNTLLIFFGFAGISGALQVRCINGACGAPISQGDTNAGFLAGNCLKFNGQILNVDTTGSSCLLEDVTVQNLFVTNQTVQNQVINSQTVLNQTIIQQTVTEQTIVQQTVVNQTTINQNNINQTTVNQVVTNQNVSNQNVAAATIDQLNVDSLVVTQMRFAADGYTFKSGPATYVQTFGFMSGYDTGGGVLTCAGASGSLSFSITVERVGTFVSGFMKLNSFVGAPIVSDNCDFFGMISGTLLPIDFLPANTGMGGYSFPFIQDQHASPPCFCSLIPIVNKFGSLYFKALATANGVTCCTGGNSEGFDAGGNYVIQSSNYFSGAAGVDSYPFYYNTNS